VYKRIKGLSGLLMTAVAEDFRLSYHAYHLDRIKREVTDSPVEWIEQSFGYSGWSGDEL
jgi:hypothetical protein